MRCFGGRLMRVQGDSMRPTLEPGALVWVSRRAQPKPGDVVATRPSACGGRAVIKRVAQVSPDGAYLLLGDNADQSTDSRSFGPVAPSELLGVVTRRFFRPP